MKRITVVLFLFALSLNGIAQNKKASLKAATEKFNAGNYEGALNDFLSLLPESPDDDKLNYKIGVCYLNSNVSKIKAVSYLEKAVKTATPAPNAYYLLGRAYHFANRFDDAIKAYTKFKEMHKGSSQNMQDVDRELDACYNAKELIKFPVDVTFENLGKVVNSPFADDFPFIPRNEAFIVYNSRRGDGNQLGVDGKFYSDVYISFEQDGKWQKSKALSTIVNTEEGDEEVIGLSADGNYALFSFDNNLGSGDIYIAKRNNETFEKPVKLPEVINSKHNEISASLSADGSMIYFTSDRPGGYGGTDIYVSTKLPKGDWGPAKNLGPLINTPYDEDFPTLALNGKTLLFSSKGHTNMGGYDIFKITWDEEKKEWTNLKNMGYPINSSGDDMNLCLAEGGRYGYMSSLREGGNGDMDIYRITFNEVEPSYSVLRGKLVSGDALKQIGPVNITVTNKANEEVYGTYLPNPHTLKYVIILPPGKYNVLVEADGFKTYSNDIEVVDKASFQPYVDKDIILQGK